jgi:hypothetical protein
MATQVIINPVVTFAGVDISANVESVEIPIELEEKEFTNAASGGNRERKAGLRDSSISLLLQQDWADNGLDETIWNALGTLVEIRAKANNAVVSASNPEYRASYLISKHTPIAGAVGDKAGMTLQWPRSGATTRAVAP